MPIDFYYAAGAGPGRIVQITAKVLGIELNRKLLDVAEKKEQLTPEFIKINPQHCVPTIVDDGFVLWESNAIATYLIQQYGKDDSLYPRDPKKRAVVDQRLYFDNNILAPRFGEYYFPIMMQGSAPNPEKFKRVEQAFEFLDIFLDGKDYVAGDFLSVADIVLSTTVTTYLVAKFDLSKYKNVAKWYKKIKSSVDGFEEFNNIEMLSAMYEQLLKKLK